VYLSSAFVSVLQDSSERRINNLRVCVGMGGSIPTRASSELTFRARSKTSYTGPGESSTLSVPDGKSAARITAAPSVFEAR
jgi:hypothetical protein